MGRMLEETYDVAGKATMQRLRRELAPQFSVAFAAAEPDLRLWMPNAAGEREDAAGFIDRCTEAFEVGSTFAYALVGSGGDVIGYLNLTPNADHCVIGYWVHPEWRGQGLAPLAVRALTDAGFAALGAAGERVHAHLDAANVASKRVLEKAGFHHRETFIRPPRTSAESNTEWLYVRLR